MHRLSTEAVNAALPAMERKLDLLRKREVIMLVLRRSMHTAHVLSDADRDEIVEICGSTPLQDILRALD